MLDPPKRSLARSFRRRPTAVERLLWKVLRDRQLADLRRQVPLGRYIADFACFRHRLIVEADGPWHDPDEDRIRDAWLSGLGFKALRFSNGLISARPHELIATVLNAVTPPAERRDSTLGIRNDVLLPLREKVDAEGGRMRGRDQPSAERRRDKPDRRVDPSSDPLRGPPSPARGEESL